MRAPVIALLLSCLLGTPVSAQDNPMRDLSGQVVVLERMALPDDTVLFVDVTVLSTGARTELRQTTNGVQSPFAFALSVPSVSPLLFRAGLRASGDLVWLSEPFALDQGTDSVALGDVRATRTAPMGASFLLQCGTQMVEIGFLPEEVRLRFNEQMITLVPDVAASEAMYVAVDDPSTSLHLKGRTALLRVDGAELSECRRISPDSDISDGVWNISAIAEKPAIFPSRTELVFFPDGRVSMTVGCNRFIGGYRRHGGFLSFGRVAGTRMACADGLAEQEAAFTQVLDKVDGYALNADGNRLTLTAAGLPVLQAQR